MKTTTILLAFISEITFAASMPVGNWRYSDISLDFITVESSGKVVWCEIHDYYYVTITKGSLQGVNLNWNESVTYDWETSKPHTENYNSHLVGKKEKAFMRDKKLVLSSVYEDEYSQMKEAIPKDCKKFF